MAHPTLFIDVEKPGTGIVYKRGYSRFIHHLLITGDLLFLNISFLVAYVLRFHENPFQGLPHHFYSLVVVGNLAWIVNVYLLNIYAVSRVNSWETIVWNVAKGIVLHSLIMALFVFTIKGYFYSRLFFGMYYGVLTIAIFSWRTIFVQLIRLYRITGHNYRNVIVIGANKASYKIYQYFLSEKSHGYNLKAVFGDNIEESTDGQVALFPESVLFDYLENEKVDEIYCALPLTSVDKIREIMSYAENNLIRFRYVPDFRALLYKKVDIEFYGTVPVLSVRSEPLENIGKRFAKRAFDLVFSCFVLLFLVPIVFPLIALLIKLSSEGPVLFRQKRSGRNNQVFYCYKFRTMRMNKHSDSKQAVKEDPRITPVGKFLRKTNLDELPQFMNVLMGQMSVVGPRPHMLKHTEEYKVTIDKFMIRHLVKPGITGWAQVNGFRGATETPQKMIKRVRYDVWYIENWSFLLDLKIIFLTVFNMAKGEKNAF